ncbi:hypothetical protein EI067_06840 [Mycobacterium paragordonae]|nr:hypothetical protein EI067_06840 [Mycobacterium paragordonae]
MVGKLGDELEELCASATHTLLLVAPFIKERVLSRLLAKVAIHDVQVTCVTRWLPQEIAAGVSDLEIWTHFREFNQRRLFLRQDLHAKYYRADERCLVGSANLTGTALGYSAAPNLEILVPCDVGGPGLQLFEEELLRGAIQVDEDIADETRSLANLLPAPLMSIEAEDQTLEAAAPESVGSLEDWTPTLRQPEDLYLAYCQDSDSLSQVARASAARDLGVLRITPGLDEQTFKVVVGRTLLRTPRVRKIDQFVLKPRRFGEVRDLFEYDYRTSETPDRRWQTLFRWMMYFLPDRYKYSRPAHSEIISRDV